MATDFLVPTPILIVDADLMTGMARAMSAVAAISGVKLGHSTWLNAISKGLGFRNPNSMSTALSDGILFVSTGLPDSLNSERMSLDTLALHTAGKMQPDEFPERQQERLKALERMANELGRPEREMLQPFKIEQSSWPSSRLSLVGVRAPASDVVEHIASFVEERADQKVSHALALLWWKAAVRAPGARFSQDEGKSMVSRLGFHLFRPVRTPSAEQLPAVPVELSVTNDAIVCLEDGKALKMLRRHLRTQYRMTPEDYRARWGLPDDYPMVAPGYAQAKAQHASPLTEERAALTPQEIWAFATTQEEVALRKRLYAQLGPSESLRRLAARFPSGSAKAQVE